MKKLTSYEYGILMNLKNELKFREKVLLILLKNYTYQIYQKGFNDRYFKK